MRIAHDGELGTLLQRLSDDECEIVLEVVRRIDAARKTYGPLRMREDQRNFPREALDESLDQTFYLAAECVRQRHLR